jgi:tetratricopeptide (TPR) repeat protein
MRKSGYFLFGLLVMSFGSPGARASEPTPAQQRIQWAEKQIQKNPKNVQGYNELAMALARRARETANPAFYAQAEESLKKSFALAPENFEGRKARTWVFLGKHEFAAALEEARKLNRQMPDDLLVYGFLVDANTELGNYKDAEEAGQWMLDMRPGAIPGLTRAAYLRELFGDVEGALELMNTAFRQTPPSEVEDRAWILTQMAHLDLSRGKLDFAEQLLTAALRLFPDYHYALGQQARLRTLQGRYAEAAALQQKRYALAPHPENLYEVAAALERAGRKQAAASAFAQFEKAARAEMPSLDNANRELTYFYLGAGRAPAEALRIAELEYSRRRDVYTLDAYAWALSHNGRFAEARKHMKAALAVGLRDANMLYRAGVIESKLKNRKAAQNYFRQSLEANAHSESAQVARAALGQSPNSLRAKAQ